MQYEFDFDSLRDYWPSFLHGALMTLEMTAVATVLGLAIGVVCAIGRRGRSRWIAGLCGAAGLSASHSAPVVLIIILAIACVLQLSLSIPLGGRPNTQAQDASVLGPAATRG